MVTQPLAPALVVVVVELINSKKIIVPQIILPGPGDGLPFWFLGRRAPATLLPNEVEGWMTLKMTGVTKMAAGLVSSSSTGA